MKRIYKKYNIPLNEFIKNNDNIINIVTKDGININNKDDNMDNIIINNKFNFIMSWLENIWNILNNPFTIREFGRLNLIVYGGVARYMVTRKGFFSDLDIYFTNDEPGTCQELFLFNIKSFLEKLYSLNLITYFKQKIFYNFFPPLIHYEFGIIDSNNFNNIIINAELLSGKPYNPFSKMDFYINNFAFDRSRKIFLRINDNELPNLSQTITFARNKNYQNFLLDFKNPDSIHAIFEFVGEIFKMIRLFSMYSKGYSITSNSKIPKISKNFNNKLKCSICNFFYINKQLFQLHSSFDFNNYFVSLQCGHSFHPYCIFFYSKFYKNHIKGLCPDCLHQNPIKLLLTNPPLLFK